MLLLEINHPAHIHLFRNLAILLKKEGISSVFLIKSDDQIAQLAKFYGLPVISMGKKGKGLLQKYLFQIGFLVKSILIAQKKKVKIGIGVSMNLPLVSKFTKMHSIGLDDDDMDVTPTFAKYANKANIILTPDALSHENRGDNHICYPGYHELAYLHPNSFAPDESVLEILGVKSNEPYFVLRFNAFTAHHDMGEEGIGYEQKKRLVETLESKGKVFLLSEDQVEKAFEHLLLPSRPELIHSMLFFATMYVGESQTMTSEAAVLGMPALKCNSFAHILSVPNELEKEYGLCYSYLPDEFDLMS